MLSAPLRIAVLSSRRAPGLLQLLDRADRCRAWKIVCVVTSEQALAEEAILCRRGVPVARHSIRDFYGARGRPVYRDFQTRAAFDMATVDLLEPHEPDLLLLDGYLYLITAPLLARFSARVLNVHFADLTDRLPDGRPRFPGMRAVRDAVAAGRPETFATIHLVNDVPDGGAPLVRSWPFPVAPLVSYARKRGLADMVSAYAFAHQEWMLNAAAGPLIAAALELITRRDIDLDELAGSDPAALPPWTLTESGRLVPAAARTASIRERSSGREDRRPALDGR
jgi:folate-dependent phosphoribosylglycinamide formyltransferase PurN